jgi:hypothetical protein
MPSALQEQNSAQRFQNQQYKNINQYYRMDNTTNQNPPYGIATFYQLGPQPYSLCPRTCHGFQPNQYNEYQNHLNTIFKDYLLPEKPNKYGIYQNNQK